MGVKVFRQNGECEIYDHIYEWSIKDTQSNELNCPFLKKDMSAQKRLTCSFTDKGDIKMPDDYTYRNLSYRLSKYINKAAADHRVYIAKELRSLTGSDWIDYYIRISYVQITDGKSYKQYELFNYWDKAFIAICDYMLRYKYSLNLPVYKKRYESRRKN